MRVRHTPKSLRRTASRTGAVLLLLLGTGVHACLSCMPVLRVAAAASLGAHRCRRSASRECCRCSMCCECALAWRPPSPVRARLSGNASSCRCALVRVALASPLAPSGRLLAVNGNWKDASGLALTRVLGGGASGKGTIAAVREGNATSQRCCGGGAHKHEAVWGAPGFLLAALLTHVAAHEQRSDTHHCCGCSKVTPH